MSTPTGHENPRWIRAWCEAKEAEILALRGNLEAARAESEAVKEALGRALDESSLCEQLDNAEAEIEKLKQKPNLAEQCFASMRAESDLYDAIDAILGKDHNGVSVCEDCWVDDYDASVEVIASRPISDYEATKILNLGFHKIWESVGEEGRLHTKDHVEPCRATKAGDRTARTKAQLREARSEIDRLSRAIGSLANETWSEEIKSDAREATYRVPTDEHPPIPMEGSCSLCHAIAAMNCSIPGCPNR